MQKKYYSLFVIALGSFLAWYLFSRASMLSMTHDESGTTDLAVVPVLDIMFSPAQFQTANNHILHSLLMKFSILMFGYKEWAVRLPNLLSFFIYFAAAVYLVQQLSSNLWMRAASLVILCSVPYLLDFFALARGYGMANAFGMAAGVLLFAYFHNQKKKFLLLSFICAALAAYSNFTWLNLYLGLWATANLFTLLYRTNKEESLFSSLFKVNLYPLLTVALLALISFKPISFLRTKDEFKWGAVNWSDSFHTFINDLLYGQKIPPFSGELSHKLLFYGLPVLLLLGTGIAAWNHFNQSREETVSSKSVLFFSSLLLIIVLGTVLQKHLLDTFYIDGRKATIYIPALVCFFVSLLSYAEEHFPGRGKALMYLSGFAAILQFGFTFNLSTCREWWYDANSKEAIYFICKDSSVNDKKVALNWLFAPSFSFYNNHQLNQCIAGVIKTNEPNPYANANYCYVIGDEIKSVPPEFRIVKRYFWDRFLLKKDMAAFELEKQSIIKRDSAAFAGLSYEDQQRKVVEQLVQQRQQSNWNDVNWKE